MNSELKQEWTLEPGKLTIGWSEPLRHSFLGIWDSDTETLTLLVVGSPDAEPSDVQVEIIALASSDF